MPWQQCFYEHRGREAEGGCPFAAAMDEGGRHKAAVQDYMPCTAVQPLTIRGL